MPETDFTEDLVGRTVRLPQDLWDQLERQAHEETRTTASLIRNMLIIGLESRRA